MVSTVGDDSQADVLLQGEAPAACSNLFLDLVGEVALSLDSEGLSWKSVGSRNDQDGSSCLGIIPLCKTESEIKLSDIYAVEFNNRNVIHLRNGTGGRKHSDQQSEIYGFTVHGFQRSKTKSCIWVLAAYTFGHRDLQTCQMWVHQINASLNMERGRPKSLLVFVHPTSGKRNGCRIWETVAPIFSRAKVKTKVIVTERAGHASDVMASFTNRELSSYDGVVTVGGDGFFGEVLNGFLSSRHKAPYPPHPKDVSCSVVNGGSESNEAADRNEDLSPLLSSSLHNRPAGFSNFRSSGDSSNTGQDPEFAIPNEWFRFGLIPAGSTDAIVICTTGARDPVTSALQIVLGKRVRLDIAQVVRWKTSSTSKDEPSVVKYAASFAGYGFYGDVITESEKYRWMGPKRYDYAGTKVFLRHRTYEAEIGYLDINLDKTNRSSLPPKKPERVVCRANCNICATKPMSSTEIPDFGSKESRWLTTKGRFISVGAAVISCRNSRAPDGLVADAHLSDGFLELILIKDCPLPHYLWHLTQLAKKGGNPLNFDFVEHHKTPAFTFTSSGSKESVWNLDGEIFRAHQLSAQVFRGLVSLFASGPEI